MLRKIHLDFHTRPDVSGIGSAFNPEEFADILAAAHVNCIATPGKCQYGETYYDTQVGHPHPGLVRKDLFPETVRACVDRGIQVQAYFTLGLDDVAANAHPEWRQTYKDGTQAKWGAKHMCFASPYVDEIVIPEALDMIARCPRICGFWFDISLYCNGAFYSEDFNRIAVERLGSGADDEHQRWLLGRTLVRECCQRIDAAVKSRLPHAENYFNSLVVSGEGENIPLQPYQEVENPIQFGGPELMTAHVRWLRWHGSPVIGLVSRFQGPWMDPGTLRTPDQIRFDVARTVALGCHVSMGDHRHPDGTLDREVYRRIGTVYADVEKCEPWLAGARPLREAVLLTGVKRGAPEIIPVLPPSTLHGARLLEEIGLQFDIATDEEDWPDAPLVIQPAGVVLDSKRQAALDRHVANGGALLILGREDADDSSRKGPDAAGHVARASSSFLRALPVLGLGDFAQIVTQAAEPLPVGEGTQVLAEMLPRYSETPPCAGRNAIGAAIVQNGRVIRSAVNLISQQMELGTPYERELLAALCDRLLPRRLVRHDAGSSVAAHLHKTGAGYALHLVHWAIERWEKKIKSVAKFPPLGAIRVEALIKEPVMRVTLESSGEEISFHQQDGLCSFVIPSMRVWQLVAIHTH